MSKSKHNKRVYYRYTLVAVAKGWSNWDLRDISTVTRPSERQLKALLFVVARTKLRPDLYKDMQLRVIESRICEIRKRTFSVNSLFAWPNKVKRRRR